MVLLSMICMNGCHEPDDCSKKGLFPSFRKNRDTPPTATVTLILYADVHTACVARARRAIASFNDSREWNFIEVQRVRIFVHCLALQETVRKIACSCFLQLEAQIIQYSPLWYYGFISYGEVVTDGKNITDLTFLDRAQRNIC